MISYLWPMALVVFSNILYNVASKSLPKDCSPFAALIVTYLTAACLSFLGFLLLDKQKAILPALGKVNWTGFALGISMVGLEIGFIFVYRSGWKISSASLVANILLAVALIIVGLICYQEKINLQQFLGIMISLLGATVLMTARD
ncbi:MAG: EamA family transporter [Desulfovibrio sp.]|nr:EamA family transporter [Desulfovibrio sp.]